MANNTVKQFASQANYKTDPLRAFKFHVIINSPLVTASNPNSNVALGFMSVSGLGVQTDIISYRQGGYNTTTQKMPGQSDFGPIVLQKGVILGDANLIDWLTTTFTVQQGTGTWDNSQDFRANVDILVLEHPVTTPTAAVKAAFRVYNAWPTQVSFNDFDAANNMFMVTQLTLAHEGWMVNFASGPGSSKTAPTPT
jgi:phage tail-like protein